MQACFAISLQETWSIEDGSFNYKTFWRTIVDLFDDQEDNWCISTLAWWSK
jgi:hypothetical protein